MSPTTEDPLSELLDRPAVEQLFAAAALEPGEHLGAYRLHRLVSRGAMGWVYEGERHDDLRRKVAIKLLPRWPGPPTSAWRFLAEREMLARLEHPGIARLYDGGTTADGLPYFVMEWVEGEPIDLYCDRRRATVRERIDLVLAVAEAVRHAHQNLIVHRDLKPSNILVDATGQPKLLDFGIAKLLDPTAASDESTAPWQRLLTPGYASPEQLRGEPPTTATDVYSLAALLYRLLTGRLPRRVEGRSISELERELEPPTAPSVAAAAASNEVAAARRTTPAALARALRGDLDAILLTALRTRPRDRYPTLDPMIDDLRRQRQNRPVRARGNARWYRLGRGLRRHRGAVAVALLALGLLAATWAMRERQAARLDQQRREHEQVAELLIGLFENDPAGAAGRPWVERSSGSGSVAPEPGPPIEGALAESLPVGSSPGAEPSAREMLRRGAQRLDGQLDGQPGLKAAALEAIGRGYLSLGLPAEAVPILRQVVRLRQAAGADLEQQALAFHRLGVALRGTADYDASRQALASALALRLQAAGADSPAVAESRFELAALLRDQGEYGEATTLAEQALAAFGEQLGDSGSRVADIRVARTRVLLGLLALERGDSVSAQEHLEAAIETFRELGDGLPLAAALDRLALVRIDRGQPEAAIELARESTHLRFYLVGDRHPLFDESRHTLALGLLASGQLAEAESLLRQTLAFHLQGSPLDGPGAEPGHGSHPAVARARFNLATALEASGQYAEAELHLRTAVEAAELSVGPNHPRLATAFGHLARVRTRLGRLDQAGLDFDRALATLDATVGPEHPFAVAARLDRARWLLARGDAATAERVYRRDLARLVELQRQRHGELARHRVGLALALVALGRDAEARTLALQALPVLEARFGADTPLAREARGVSGRVPD